ncbi:hypothetical protein V8C40DRAFT_231593 [Trichoderma camerunense]
MLPEDPTRSGGIDDTVEWRLIDGLRQNSRRFAFSLPRGVAASSYDRKTQKLRNAIDLLDAQIRRTFTVLHLEKLLYLELEREDNESQASSEFETDAESSRTGSDSDDDDTSSQSSMASQSISPPNERLGSLDRSSRPSADEALSHLRELCFFLETRVNRLLIAIEPRDNEQPGTYPRLTRLIEYLYSLSPSITRLEFIPSARSTSTQFLFNIADDEATADAFVAFTGREQKRPPRETRQRMLTYAESLCQSFLSFNCFIDKLQFSAASLDNLAIQSFEESASNQLFPTFTLLQKFRQQVATAYRAILSHVSCCNCGESTKHKILLQLPGWRDISESDSRNVTENLSIQLFFTIYPNSDWQLARMSFLMPERIKACRQQQLCHALISSHNRDMDLEFYVSEDCKEADNGKIPIHVPTRLERTRKYGGGCPSYENSLQTLIENGHFAKELNPDLLHSTGGTGTILGINQRKALAIKLVLGLMVSMDSDHVFESWDPRRIHFLKPMDDEYTPFVSIPGYQENTFSRRKRLSLATPSHYNGIDEDDLKPLPQFALLAKALLQIARGDRIRWVKKSNIFKIHKRSQSAFLTEWKDLRNTIEAYSRQVACGQQVDREILPFVQAALGCLDFHIDYQIGLMEAKSRQKIDVAWKVVFDTILAKIDGNLTLKELNKSSTDALTKENPLPVTSLSVVQESSTIVLNTSTKTSTCTTIIEETLKEELPIRCVGDATAQPGQTNVELFDTKHVAKASTADEFWTLLEKFHESYSRFVPERDTQSGVESPQRIRIAVLDTGIDFNHSAIAEAREKGRMKNEWCYSWVGDTSDTTDDDNELHGTNCAYLLHKVAPEADIYVEKVFRQNSLRFYEAENISKAINHAVNTWNVDIISMSFGLRRPTARGDGNKDEERIALEKYREIIDDIENAIRDASHKSRVIFAAASNSGKNEPRAFPAKYQPFVICVHASEGNGEDGGINPEMEDGFNFMTLGMGIELVEREWVDKSGRRFAKYKKVIKSGTSFATPIAAGIAATVLDLSNRMEVINSWAKKRLRRPEGMVKILRIMSSPKNDAQDRLYYMAPWHLWESGWELDESKCRLVWDRINQLF